ncbi:MAG: alpha/beta hydrolase [Candidatus Limisoma sp.]
MVQKFDFWYAAANDNRRIHLYLPDDYEQSDERYAVLYMFDGHNLFYDGDATFGKSLGLKDFLDHWWKKLIVVGIACANEDRTRVEEYCPYELDSRIYGHIRGRGHATFEWIAGDLKNYIDSRYRTWAHREATAIAGYSMGGMMALYGIVKFNHIFSKAAVISPAVQPAMEVFRNDIQAADLAPDTRTFFSWGTEELRSNPGLADRVRDLEGRLQAKGTRTYLYCNVGGNHNEASWQNEVPCWMRFLWEQ